MTPRSLRILAQAALVADRAPEDRWTKVGPGVFQNALGHFKTEGMHVFPDGGAYICQASDSPQEHPDEGAHPSDPSAPSHPKEEKPSGAVSTGSAAENAAETPRERCWRLCSELAKDFSFNCSLVDLPDGGFRVTISPPIDTLDEKPPLGPVEVWFDEAAQITPEQWAALRPAGSTHEHWRGSHRIMGLIEIVSENIDKITKSPWPQHKRSLRWDHISDMMDKAWHEMTDEEDEHLARGALPPALAVTGSRYQMTEFAKLLHERGAIKLDPPCTRIMARVIVKDGELIPLSSGPGPAVDALTNISNISGPPQDPVSFSKLIEQFSDQITAALAVKESGQRLSMTVCHICSTPFPTHLGPECPRKGLGCPYGTEHTREMARVIAERSRS